MSETKSRVYEEGNYGLTVFPKTDTSTNPKYGTGVSVEGLVSVDITFSSTRTKTAADDVADYLNRVSPVKGDGTITLIGFTKAMYQQFFNNIVDTAGAIVVGKKNQTKPVGLIFYNTENYEGGTSENMFVLPNVTIELPNLSTTTIAEDDTTKRDYALTIQVNPQNYVYGENQRDRYTYAILNSVDDSTIYSTKRGKIYLPDGAAEGTI